MRKLLGAVALFALLPAVSNAQMTWRSSETPKTEWAVIDCVSSNGSPSSCGWAAAVFVDTCQKEESLSEATCKQVINRDIFAFIARRIEDNAQRAVEPATQYWHSDATHRTEQAVIDCVNDHKSSWGSSCGFEAATFIDTCQKEEGLSEAACTQIIKRDIFAFIQG